MERKGKWISLNRKVSIVIMVVVLILACGLAGIAYYVNGTRTDRYYKDSTAKMAATVAYFVDGDYVLRLRQALESEAFAEVRRQAVEADDKEQIIAWLREQGLYEQFDRMNEMLRGCRDRLGAESVYLQSLSGNLSINLVDPSEDMLYVGSLEISVEEFSQYDSNERIEPTVSTTEFGWLCSAYEPVVDSNGQSVAIAGVDISMDKVMKERRQFLLIMMLYAAVLMAVLYILGLRLMRKIATNPLEMLSKAVVGFADAKKGYTEADIISLPIHSNDEIEDLYHEIRNMQGRMVEYLDNLTRVTAEKERIGAELNVATQIQADMLPRIFPPFPERTEFEIFASMDPAKEVGGDFYDFFLVDENHLALVIADVSGKGVPAALFMVIAKTLIKNSTQMGKSPAKVLTDVNEQLCEGNEANLFVTVWLAVIDIRTGRGVAVNAGHEHPVLRRKDGKYELVVYRHSMAVATMEGLRFKEHPFELYPGDSLFVYTDGVPEATNENNEMYGTDRMLEVLNRNPDAGMEEQLINIQKEMNVFVGSAPQFDDVTMLGFKYYGSGAKNMFEITIDAKVEALPDVLAFIDSHLEKMDVGMKVQMQIDIAVEEIFVNIASYAYPEGNGKATISISEKTGPRAVSISFKDSGMPYDPLAKEDPDVTLSAEERQIGGLGIFMVKKSMDDVLYEYRNGCNNLTLIKNL
ncbi:MAG: SpoIIE family protein phosphatase [Clostridia bacterium]|nr:SpoIIE family protein phosphatase [Clostridia bacterium]